MLQESEFNQDSIINNPEGRKPLRIKTFHKVMEQTAAQSAQQQTERKIAELEQKYGISTAAAEQPGGDQQPKEPGEPQPKITREEYEVIKSVFVRLGCDSLITYSNFFDNFFGLSYEKFFKYQPAALRAIAEQMERETDTRRRNGLQVFIDGLEAVNATIYRIVENSPVFDEAEILCDTLDIAHYEYELKTK